jgi:hypothetical protein
VSPGELRREFTAIGHGREKKTAPEDPWQWAGCFTETTVGQYHPELPPSYRSDMLRDIFGNPFRPVVFSAAWRTDTALSLARQMYDSRDFSAMPILADALQDAGCDSDDVLNHCRQPGEHVRGCWVVDLVLGKEEGSR